ncbi:MAG: radical SAM protein [Desulfurococcales archaeon]|nr:radical SAM protein [Desulfurococcales archaeon]
MGVASIVGCIDPVKLSRRVEAEVTRETARGLARRYWRFRSSRHYGGNNAGDVVGCNLRCAFCWAWRYAFKTKAGFLLDPIEAARRLVAAGPYRLVRLTGGEPTIGWSHTRRVIELATSRGRFFVLETNGVLIGAGLIEARDLPRGNVFIRVSLKAPDPEVFERVTGACRWGFDLQLKSLERLLEWGFVPGRDFRASLVMGLVEASRYRYILSRLEAIHPRLVEELEPEYIVLYPHVKELLDKRGFRPYQAVEP